MIVFSVFLWYTFLLLCSMCWPFHYVVGIPIFIVPFGSEQEPQDNDLYEKLKWLLIGLKLPLQTFSNKIDLSTLNFQCYTNQCFFSVSIKELIFCIFLINKMFMWNFNSFFRCYFCSGYNYFNILWAPKYDL